MSALTPQQLQEDLMILRKTLEEAHPGLYTYVDPAARAAQFDDVQAQLDHAMSDIAFYRLIAPLVADIHDAHTTAWLAPDSVIYRSEGAGFLPFTVRFIENRAFVDAIYFPDAGMTPTMELLAINDVAITEIVAQLLPYVPHDGYSETSKPYLLSRGFPLYYGFVFEPSDVYALSLRDPRTGDVTKAEMPSLSPVELAAWMSELVNPDQNLSVELLEQDSVALLTIRSFGDPGLVAFLADAFERLKGMQVQDLIIDLRGNGGGGNLPGGLLYAYLTDEPFRYYDHLGIVLDRPLTYLQHTDLSASRMNEILQRTVETADGARRYPHWYGFDQIQQPEPNAYGGNVYILIDGGCGSSTAEFAAIAHNQRRGVFIGEETGGTYLSNNSGEMPALTLPNSGIRVIIPLFQFVMAVSEPPFGRGIQPDHAVRPTVDDFLAGIDTELAFALDLIQASR
jgi:hypothetical protein